MTTRKRTGKTSRRESEDLSVHLHGAEGASCAEVETRGSADAPLQESGGWTDSIVEAAMDAIIAVDEAQQVILFNGAAEQMFGMRAEDVIGKPLDLLLPGRYRAMHKEHVRSFGRTRSTKRAMGGLGAVWGSRADGEEFPVEASISQVEVGGRKIFTAILRDITERQRAEERIREQAELLDQAHEAILVRDLDDRIRYWNKGAERMYGWTAEEAFGLKVQELIYHDDLSAFERATLEVREASEWNGELEQTTKEGKPLVVECRWTLTRDGTGSPKSIFVINADITERKKLEAQFLRAQRMESIGTLAGGIAHDLNNVLSPILMSIRMLQMRIEDETCLAMLEAIRASAMRGSDMVKQVLLFARGASGDRSVVQPRHLVKEVVKILGETFPKTISIEFAISADLWLVRGDPTQLYQVLMNLCVNARDAMANGGRLTIRAQNIRIDEHYARMHLEATPGQFIVISVEDTGVGMSRDVLDRVFEPFFTTKPQGHGTGIGLSTALGIVKGHGGFISVYSEVGRGTQFKVHLPAVEVDEVASAEPATSDLPAGHGEGVLVVDDEAAIREIGKGTLEAFGYKVRTAVDGAEAVAEYAAHRDEIHVVVLDMMMPVMDGPATARALQRLSPDVKIIATSGLPAGGKIAEATTAGVAAFLAKPYTAEDLLKAIARVLASGA
jgi:two-component system cell cycle sensor histidine kinase/response regulator CckA